MEHRTDINEVLESQSPYGIEYTYADYLTWRFDEMVELIRGKVFRMSPAPGTSHQTIVGHLYLEVAQFLRMKPCKVFLAPIDVILPINNKKRESATTVVQPDLCVICNQDLIEERGCFGAPDWVVEVISPHTSKKDIQLKYDVYEEARVKEYWMVFPKSQIVEIFVLEENQYKRKGMFVFEDTVSPTILPELEIDLAAIFEKKHEI